MEIYIQYDSDKPLYEQIEDSIKEEIYRNNVEDNEPLPSVRQLSTQLNVSAITVKRAYADLEKEGFTYSISGKGTFIKMKQIEELRQQRNEEIKAELRQKVELMKKAGFSRSEVEDIVEAVFLK